MSSKIPENGPSNSNYPLNSTSSEGSLGDRRVSVHTEAPITEVQAALNSTESLLPLTNSRSREALKTAVVLEKPIRDAQAVLNSNKPTDDSGATSGIDLSFIPDSPRFESPPSDKPKPEFDWDLSFIPSSPTFDLPPDPSPIYSGPQKNNQPHGNGTMSFPNGIVIQGNWIDGHLSEGVISYPDGARYEGQINGIQRHGSGIFTTPNRIILRGIWNNDDLPNGSIDFLNGSKYIGQIRNLNPLGEGQFIYSNGFVYNGQIVHGVANGVGELTLPDGSKETGIFENGVLKYPRHHFPNGSFFDGPLVNGKRLGFGILTQSDGTRITGEWDEDDILKGQIQYPDGSLYQGELYELRPHGSGIQWHSDGRIEEGGWDEGKFTHVRIHYTDGSYYDGERSADNQRNGFGRTVLPSGIELSGRWENDTLAFGQLKWPDGRIYNGVLNNGVPIRGSIRYPNGIFYAGHIHNDVPDGQGSMTLASKTRFEGNWSNGQLHAGSVVFPNGARYEGELRNYGLNGKGILYSKDGVRIEAEWLDGQPKYSNATLTNPSGAVYTGSVLGLDPTGLGRLIDNDSVSEGLFAHSTFECGLETIPGSSGAVRIESRSPGELGNVTNLEDFELEACGAILNRWESPAIGSHARLPIHLLLRDLRSFPSFLEQKLHQPRDLKPLPPEMAPLVEEYNQHIAAEHLEIMEKGQLISGSENWPVDEIAASQEIRPRVFYGKVNGHAISYVMYKNNLYICQGGVSIPNSSSNTPGKIAPIVQIPFKPESLGEVLSTLSQLTKNPSLESAWSILYGSGPDSIRARFGSSLPDSRDSLAESLTLPEWSFNLRTQRVGNCSFFSPLTAALCVGALLLENHREKNLTLATPLEKIGRTKVARDFYKLFREHERQDARSVWDKAPSFEMVQPNNCIFKSLHGHGNPVSGRGFLIRDGQPVGYGEVKNGIFVRGFLVIDNFRYTGTFNHDLTLQGPGKREDLLTQEKRFGNFDQGKLTGRGYIHDVYKGGKPAFFRENGEVLTD